MSADRLGGGEQSCFLNTDRRLALCYIQDTFTTRTATGLLWCLHLIFPDIIIITLFIITIKVVVLEIYHR